MRSVRIDFSTDGAVTGVLIVANSDREESMISGQLESILKAPAWKWISRLLTGGRLGGNALQNARRIK
ncbi:MAG: hypothetical protein AB7W37_18080 [Syntrophobacteraceae bacterium]